MQESGQYLPRGAPVLVEYLPLLSSGLAFLVSSVSVAPQWPTLPAPRAASNLHSRIDEQIERVLPAQPLYLRFLLQCVVCAGASLRRHQIHVSTLAAPGHGIAFCCPPGSKPHGKIASLIPALLSTYEGEVVLQLESLPLSSRQIQQQLTIILSDAESVSSPQRECERERPWSLLGRLWWSFTQQASERL